jgi:hypothetical protein
MTMDSLTEEEFKEMLRLLERFVSTDMDQWEFWKFDSPRGKVFVEVGLEPRGNEDAYTELSHLL